MAKHHNHPGRSPTPRWYMLPSWAAAAGVLLVALALFFLALRCEGQSASRADEAVRAEKLPAACLQAVNKSLRVSGALETRTDHPSAAAYSVLAAFYAQKGDSSCAADAYRLALRLDPSSSGIHYRLGVLLLSQGQFFPALKELRAAVHQKPDMFLAHNALGLALQKLGELDEGAEQFQTALRINPEYVYAAANVASYFLVQK